MNDDKLVGAIIEKIANGESIEYNPVYFHSEGGINEDFLDAIGMKYQEKHPGDLVIRVSAEDFSKEFVRAVREGRLESFLGRHKSSDLLMVSEIEHMAGKPATMESLYVCMDRMLEAGKRIVIGASCAPAGLTGIDDRIVTIFSGGLILHLGSGVRQ